MNIFKLCAAILQDFGHPKNRCWHTQLNVCEKEGFPCFLYLIQIFEGHKQKLGSRKNSMVYRTIALTIGNFYTQKVKWSLYIIWSQLDLKIAVKCYLPILAKTFKELSISKMNECLSSC